MLLNLTSVVDWWSITVRKQQKPNIYNVQENVKQVKHSYAIGDLLSMDTTGIYHKLDYKIMGRLCVCVNWSPGCVI